MQGRGETDADTCQYNDFALVKLAAADVAEVNPSVPKFGGPTGLRSGAGMTPGTRCCPTATPSCARASRC